MNNWPVCYQFFVHFCIYSVSVAMSYTQRQELLGNGLYNIEMSDVPKYYNAADSDQDNWQHIDSDEEGALRQPPPGEEGEYHSHAGKEAIFHEIYEKCKPG
jgi:hypothetical protein